MSLQCFCELNEVVQEREWVWIIGIDELIFYGPCNEVDAAFGLDMKGYDHVFVQLHQISFNHFVCNLLLLLIYVYNLF